MGCLVGLRGGGGGVPKKNPIYFIISSMKERKGGEKGEKKNSIFESEHSELVWMG